MLYKHYISNVNNPPNEMKKWSSRALGDKFVNKRSLINKKIKVTSLKARKPMNLKEHKDKLKTLNKKSKNKNHDMIKKKKKPITLRSIRVRCMIIAKEVREKSH